MPFERSASNGTLKMGYLANAPAAAKNPFSEMGADGFLNGNEDALKKQETTSEKQPRRIFQFMRNPFANMASADGEDSAGDLR
ncbi:hypothetical protein DQ04_03151000 [Trypanosoma grayi]|uniref:hypothetical protein n=1 Tax=Trypanosoma grayi TaxID=71804 RepID=UPI0004F4BDB4|nr:hypothetical protein DQ04_03151000 [Trypanosoma grayi]KEG10915.1 hypothetical protein DQ04_03151000 [Trypanosoma grayi]